MALPPPALEQRWPPGTVLRHYKGGRYRVTGYCLIEATLETGVLYEPLQAPGSAPSAAITWMRPLPQFSQSIETASGVVPRFCVESGDD